MNYHELYRWIETLSMLTASTQGATWCRGPECFPVDRVVWADYDIALTRQHQYLLERLRERERRERLRASWRHPVVLPERRGFPNRGAACPHRPHKHRRKKGLS